MSHLQVKIKPIHPGAVIPKYATPGAAAFDLCAICDGVVEILPGASAVFRTGLTFEFPNTHVMLINSRSGHGFKSGVRLVNSQGVIDSDYRGELAVGLFNGGKDAFYVSNGDRIAQAMMMEVPSVEFLVVDELGETQRGTGGFGSTGA